jgi:hypothetical protein
MSNMDLARPDRIDIVAVEQVEARLRREYGALLELTRAAFETSAVAAELERRVVEERVDPDAAFWMFARLYSFLTDLRLEGEAEAAAIEQAARHRAECIRRSASGVHLSLTGALASRSPRRSDPRDPHVSDEIRWSAPGRAATAAPPAREAITPVLAQVESRLPAVEVVTPAPAVAPVPAPPPAPTSDGVVLFAELRALDDDVADGVDQSAEPDAGFWDDEVAAPWWRRRRLVSAGAALQASAALLGAAAVAVHFA